MEEIKRKITQANEAEVSELLDAVLERYAVLYPDWDVGTISVRKCEDRNKQIDETIRVLQSIKDSL